MTAEYWADYDRRHPTPTPEEWVRTVAQDGGIMPVHLKTQHCPDCSTTGDLDPRDLASVLALLDEARARLAECEAKP